MCVAQVWHHFLGKYQISVSSIHKCSKFVLRTVSLRIPIIPNPVGVMSEVGVPDLV